MRKIMNSPAALVDESLEGIIKAHPKVLKFAENNNRAVVRADAPVKNKVAIITGGGYGHLPVFLGYVGKGLCDGVAVGNVFTSPSSDAIVDAAKAANSGSGVLFLYANYTGDTLNFNMAGQMLEMDDIAYEFVKISDDIASAPRDEYQERRGVAGIFFAYKIAGAKAEEGSSLDEVKNIAQRVCDNVATLGFSMSSCQLPGAPKPIFNLAEDEMELGMGIHGEPGVERVKLLPSAQLASNICGKLAEDLALTAGTEVSVLINGLGATSREELYVLFNDVRKVFEEKGIKIYKAYVGEYATSLEMLGASVSVLKMDDEFKTLLEKEAYSPFIVL